MSLQAKDSNEHAHRERGARAELLLQFTTLRDNGDVVGASAFLEETYLRADLSQDELLELAKNCRSIGKRDLAYRYLKRGGDCFEPSAEVLFNLGLAQLDQSAVQDAVNTFEALTSKVRDRGEYWFWKSRAYLYNGENVGKIAKAQELAVETGFCNEYLVWDIIRLWLYEKSSRDVLSQLLGKCSGKLDDGLRVLIDIGKMLDDPSLNRERLYQLASGRIRNISNFRNNVIQVQRMCRDVFADPSSKNHSAAMAALRLFFDLSHGLAFSEGYGALQSSLEDACRGIAAFAERVVDGKTIVLVQVSAQYVPAFQVWYELFKRLHCERKLLLIALDGQTTLSILHYYPELAERLYLVPLFPHTPHIAGNGMDRNFYWYVKALILRSAMDAGRHVIISDVDAFWKKDISPYFEYEFDVLGSDLVCQQEGGLPKALANHWGLTVCAGFWGLKDNKETKGFVDKLLEYTLYFWDDQIGLNFLMLNGGAGWVGTRGERCSAQLGYDEFDRPLCAVALPESITNRDIWQLEREGPAVVHGQYFKHESWARSVVLGENHIPEPEWQKHQVPSIKAVGFRNLVCGYSSEAMEILSRCVQADANDIESLIWFGISCKACEKYDRALEAFLRVLAQEENHVHALMWAGRVHSDLNQDDEALAYFSRALKIESDHKEAFVQKALVLKKLGRNEESLDVIRAAQRLWPDDQAFITNETDL